MLGEIESAVDARRNIYVYPEAGLLDDDGVVFARAVEIENKIVAIRRVDELEPVAAVSAHEDVSAAGTDQQIVAIAAGEDVGGGGSGEHVVEGCAGEVLEAGEGVDAGAEVF